MGHAVLVGGASGGTLSEDVTARRADVVKGYRTIASDSGDEVAEGTMEEIAAIDPAKSCFFSGGKLYVRMSPGAHRTNAISGYPEASVEGAALRQAISYTDASKVRVGTTIAGLAGTLQVNSLASFSAAAPYWNQVDFTWNWPSSGPYSGVIIRYKTGSYPTSVTDGTLAYKGAGNAAGRNQTSTASAKLFSANTTYYFQAWAYVTTTVNGQQGDELVSASYLQATAKTKAQGTKIFTSSGTFTVPDNVSFIDVFCVGGGGAGASGSYAEDDYDECGSGGGGGYTATRKSIAVNSGQTIAVTVGAGGKAPTYTNRKYTGGTDGGTSSFGEYLSAAGGKKGADGGNDTGPGGDGGSGGGGRVGWEFKWSGPGGSDGASAGGTGQGTTTRAFGESSGTLYAGGGGAGGYSGGSGGGGRGGGASGGNAWQGADGTKNTGGGGGGGWYGSTKYWLGGAGGSGVVIVRWGYDN